MTINKVFNPKTVKIGDVYERAAWATAEEFKAFLRNWRAQAGTIKDRGPHYGVEVVKVIAPREMGV
jgi:hypothetical protein